MPFRSVELQRVTRRTVELVLNQLRVLGEHPILVVEHLGESNTEFWNDLFARASSKGVEVGSGKGATPTKAAADANRRKNRETVTRFAVKATRGFFHDRDDAPGVPDPAKPATAEDVPAIVDALPDDVFDSVLFFCLNPDNFRDAPRFDDPKAIAEK